jgi:hypothetical protein
MRTTLNLDDDALDIIREYSEERALALGKAASELVRKGAVSTTPIQLVDGFVVFNVPAGSPKITSERVKKLLDSDLDDIILSSRR